VGELVFSKKNANVNRLSCARSLNAYAQHCSSEINHDTTTGAWRQIIN